MKALSHIARTLLKFARGRPHDRDRSIGFANAVAAFQFLSERKLGSVSARPLLLGYAGRRHEWVLQRREDLTVLEEVFLDEDYDMAIPPPAVVFDLGANIGAASVYFALRWPNARILSVEPSPEMHLKLRENTAIYKNIRCVSYAAGAVDGVLPFTVSASSVGGGFYRNEAGAAILEVPVRSLKSLMKEFGFSRINLLKFDIEGAEGLLFQDPVVLKSVDAFVGEIHPDLMTMQVESFIAQLSDFELQRRELAAGRFLLRGVRRS
jgi:FkbM family methyltransferase